MISVNKINLRTQSMWLVKTQFELHLTAPQGCFKCAQKCTKLILVPNYIRVLPKTRTKFSTSCRKTNYRKQGGPASDSTRRRSNMTWLMHPFLDDYFEGSKFTPELFSQEWQAQSPLSSLQSLQNLENNIRKEILR